MVSFSKSLFVLGCCSALYWQRAAAQHPPASYDFSPVTRKVQGWVDSGYYRGASLVIAKNDKVIYERYFGNYGPETVAYIASAGKWLAAATLAAVVEEGSLSWDDPVSKWLPEFKDVKGRATLRQLFSHTSGYPDYQPKGAPPDHYQTLSESVKHIVNLPADTTPGTLFHYGGLAMQVAGRMAEVATGKDWETLFQEKIARPLNMPHTHFTPVDSTPGHNPMLGGGARTSLQDYLHFLFMIAHNGRYDNKRVLSARSVALLQADEVGQAVVPPGEFVANARASLRKDIYGLGEWREEVNERGKAVLISSPSWAGAYPWIDKTTGVYGFLLTRVAAVKGGFSSFYGSPVLPLMVREVLKRAADSAQVKSGWIIVDPQTRLYYEEAGKGEPLVLIHGHSLDRRMWEGQFRALSQKYRVIRYDLRGYGWSSMPREDRPFLHADDLEKLLLALHIGKAHLVGLSMGSWVASDFLALHAHQVLSLTLSSGTVRHFPGPDQPMNAAEREKRRQEIQAYRQKGIDASKREWFAALMASGGSHREAMRQPLWDMIYQWDAWQPQHLEPRLVLGEMAIQKLKARPPQVPVLVIRGENDGGKEKNEKIIEEAKAIFPQAQGIILKDCGHMLNMEVPDEFNRVLLQFLEKAKAGNKQ